MNPNFKPVSIWKTTHEKLAKLAESQSRSHAGQIDYLVNEEIRRLSEMAPQAETVSENEEVNDVLATWPDLLSAAKAAKSWIEQPTDDPRHIRMTLFEAIETAEGRMP